MTKRRFEDSDRNNDERSDDRVIVCQEPPCILNKVPVELFSEHAMQYHEHRCEACLGNLVTERLLELHLQEYHNPFISNKKLQCFEPNCSQLFSTHGQRVYHLRDDHNYPETFDFNILQNGYRF